jgi:23S rRNA pseudouridine1911/1915/1917 synthase
MEMSTGLMNKLKWGDSIQVNGTPQHTDFPVKPGDRITVNLNEPEPQYPAEDGELTILWEDDHLLAVDKPSGMLIHPSRSCNSGTLANFVLGYYHRTGQKCAFHPITRLDRDTFGVVLLAKNAHVHARMSDLHSQGQLQKCYHALVLGTPEPAEGLIDAPIERLPLPSLLRKISPKGKPSQTRYRLLERLDGFSKLALWPITGRTHQLRLHCAHIGCPILGDPQYGGEAALAAVSVPGQRLCAKSLRFRHPITGEEIYLESKMNPEL